MRVEVGVAFMALTMARTVCLAQGGARAQNFETISVAGGVDLPVADSYEGIWLVLPGGFGRASTNFYGGRAHLAILLYDNDNEDQPVPDFLVLQGEAGWGYALHLPADVEVVGGAHFGAIRFHFSDNEQFEGFLQDETEWTAGLFARLQVPIARRIAGVTEFHWSHVFTAEPISLTRLQIGLTFTFSSPEWLRGFLQ